jgi:hypothetical protein
MSSAEEEFHVSTVTGGESTAREQVQSPLSEPDIYESAHSNNTQNGNESRGRRRTVSINEQENGGSSRRSTKVNREFLVHRGRRKSYNTLVRPAESAKAMSFWDRTWSTMRTYLFCRRKRQRESNQYRIPPADEFKFVPFLWFSKLTEGQAVDFCLWHYRTGFTWSILAFLLFYFILIFVYSFIIRGSSIGTFKRTGERCLTAWSFENDSSVSLCIRIDFLSCISSKCSLTGNNVSFWKISTLHLSFPGPLSVLLGLDLLVSLQKRAAEECATF